MKDIKNIIFDLGGVIIDIHPQKTYEAFSEHFQEMPQMTIYLSELFHQLETGKIDAVKFIREAKKEWKLNVPDEKIYDGLNAMLGEIPMERIEAIRRIQGKYDTFLLSNTNSIHFDSVTKILKETTLHSFEALFKKAYYSHIVGLRKPDVRIYEMVLNENQLLAEETLFLDDLGENLKGASSIGIHTIKVTKDNDIVEILSKF